MMSAARPFLRISHRWLGLLACVLIIVQALTGLIVLFRSELNQLVQSHAMSASSGGARVSLDVVLAAARRARPQEPIERIEFPARAGGVFLVRHHACRACLLSLTTIDPATGAVRSSGPLAAYPIEAAFYLHYQLLSPRGGRYIVGLTGLSLLFLAATGPILWWPGKRNLRQGFRMQLTGPHRRQLFDLHRVTGATFAVFIGLTALTGAGLAYRNLLDPLLRVSPDTKMTSAAEAGSAGSQPLESLFRSARRAVPRGAPFMIRFPQASGSVRFQFAAVDETNPRALAEAWVEPGSGAVRKVVAPRDRSPAEQLLGWLRPLHTGEALGRFGTLIQLAVGLALCALVVTGPWLWLRRQFQARDG